MWTVISILSNATAKTIKDSYFNYRNNSEVTSKVAPETKTGEDIKSSLSFEYLCNSGNQWNSNNGTQV